MFPVWYKKMTSIWIANLANVTVQGVNFLLTQQFWLTNIFFCQFNMSACSWGSWNFSLQLKESLQADVLIEQVTVLTGDSLVVVLR